MASVKNEHIVYIRGKPHIKFSGLLDMAHEQGLTSIKARFLQVTPDLATAIATVTFENGHEFTECGEATPKNVNNMVAPHFARMALTRAKARALRDALNISMVATEEVTESGSRHEEEPVPPPRVSEAELQTLFSLLEKKGVLPSHGLPLCARVYPDGLSMEEFSEELTTLGGQADLPAYWLLAYVSALRETYHVSKDTVIEYLVTHFKRRNPLGLTRPQWDQFIAWLTQPAKPAESMPSFQTAPEPTNPGHSNSLGDWPTDVYQPGQPSPPVNTPTTPPPVPSQPVQAESPILDTDLADEPTYDASGASTETDLLDWAGEVDRIHNRTLHEFMDIEDWLIKHFGEGRIYVLNDLPQSAMDRLKEMDDQFIGMEIDRFLASEGQTPIDTETEALL